MLSLFKKFKAGLTKTVAAIAAKTHGLFGGRKIDAASLEELEEALYTADFGVETTTEILAEIKTAYRQDAELKGQQSAAIGAAVLRRVLAGAEGRLELTAHPTTICLIGVNGSGKTTTTAKLAHRLKGDGQTVLVAACDTFRAAAIEQLRSWTERLGIELDELSATTLRFHVSRCAYAELYRAKGVERLGTAFSCRRDEPFAQAFLPGVDLEQSQTILEGAATCEFVYTLKDPESGTR